MVVVVGIVALKIKIAWGLKPFGARPRGARGFLQADAWRGGRIEGALNREAFAEGARAIPELLEERLAALGGFDVGLVAPMRSGGEASELASKPAGRIIREVQEAVGELALIELQGDGDGGSGVVSRVGVGAGVQEGSNAEEHALLPSKKASVGLGVGVAQRGGGAGGVRDQGDGGGVGQSGVERASAFAVQSVKIAPGVDEEFGGLQKAVGGGADERSLAVGVALIKVRSGADEGEEKIGVAKADGEVNGRGESAQLGVGAGREKGSGVGEAQGARESEGGVEGLGGFEGDAGLARLERQGREAKIKALGLKGAGGFGEVLPKAGAREGVDRAGAANRLGGGGDQGSPSGGGGAGRRGEGGLAHEARARRGGADDAL